MSVLKMSKLRTREFSGLSKVTQPGMWTQVWVQGLGSATVSCGQFCAWDPVLDPTFLPYPSLTASGYEGLSWGPAQEDIENYTWLTSPLLRRTRNRWLSCGPYLPASCQEFLEEACTSFCWQKRRQTQWQWKLQLGASVPFCITKSRSQKYWEEFFWWY